MGKNKNSDIFNDKCFATLLTLRNINTHHLNTTYMTFGVNSGDGATSIYIYLTFSALSTKSEYFRCWGSMAK